MMMKQRSINQFKLPVVDFSSFLSLYNDNFHESREKGVSTDEQLNTAKQIDEANKKHGFVCLRNSGITKSTLNAAFKSTQELFRLDDKIKNEQLKQIDPASNTGYAGFGMEALNQNRSPDLKEAFNIRNMSKENGEFDGTPLDFDKNSMQLWDELKLLGHRYAICCALGLEFERDYFSKTLSTMDLCTLRMLHYPPCPRDEIDDGSNNITNSIRVGEHTDFGIFTFLFVNDFHDESSHGLQVKAVEGGDLNSFTSSPNTSGKDFYLEGWNDVTFDQDMLRTIDNDETCAVIVNTGALMARWTNDTWRATAHRVIVSSAQARLSHRYSIAMFFDPDKETICSVHPKLIEENGSVAKYPPIKSLDYLMMKLKEAQGVD
jgi:isopenicillin N synthase-like dioxygenase